MKLEKLNTPNCPYTLKEFKSSKGEYCLKSNIDNSENTSIHNYKKYLKLYKKENIDGLATYRLIAQKFENETALNSIIIKNLFNQQGELIENASINFNAGEDRTLIVNGKSLDMSKKLILSNEIPADDANLILKFNFKEKLTPMAKRVLSYLKKFK